VQGAMQGKAEQQSSWRHAAIDAWAKRGRQASKQAGRTSSWLSVFSRSSLPPAKPPRPRARPMASISSAGEGQGRG
jgi:hypothetical protein